LSMCMNYVCFVHFSGSYGFRPSMLAIRVSVGSYIRICHASMEQSRFETPQYPVTCNVWNLLLPRYLPSGHVYACSKGSFGRMDSVGQGRNSGIDKYHCPPIHAPPVQARRP
jgi:hypothetical protein